MRKHAVTVKQINWLDKETKEGDVEFELNGMIFNAFCHPCNFAIGETSEVYFSIIEEDLPDDSFWNENVENMKSIIKAEDADWRYYCYGQIEQIHPVIVNCGDITFSLGDWLNDEIVISSYVYFVIDRLDITKAEV